jgi:hypothetical protein
MRVVMVSKALVVGAYQRKAEELARLGVELTVLAPPSWRDSRGEQVATAHYTDGYTFRIIPIRFNGQFHLHYYPTLAQELQRLRPDILHFDEEPYNLATWLGVRVGVLVERGEGPLPVRFLWNVFVLGVVFQILLELRFETIAVAQGTQAALDFGEDTFAVSPFRRVHWRHAVSQVANMLNQAVHHAAAQQALRGNHYPLWNIALLFAQVAEGSLDLRVFRPLQRRRGGLVAL